jgi:aspartyl-tRNA(Asn)/glutamyl-tRNA(Gln) amidotransferase subunit B
MSEKQPSVLDSYPEFEAVIGMEVHVQLKTQSKLFCSCPNQFGDVPNSNICPICTGQPGTLPVLNKKAINYAIMLGLATNSKIAKVTKFARKHYTYPDIPKNFQITQSNLPICRAGFIPIELEDAREKQVRLIRIHIEEDAGKNIHGEVANESYVDLNRAGTPLLEIVSEPDLSSSFEVKAYLMRLHAIIRYLGISDADMEKGTFRADTNISVKRKGETKLGTRTELKNINSFRFIVQATEYEIQRQIEAILEGKTITQETRLWDTKNHQTVAMRSKESAQDYRYFTEPDIPTVMIDNEWIKKAQDIIPELPHIRARRLQKEFDISAYEAENLIAEQAIADFFEAAANICHKPKQVSNWILRDLLGYLKEHKLALGEVKITPETLAELVLVIDKGVINTKTAQDVFLEMMRSDKFPSVIIQEKGLTQIDSEDKIEEIVLVILQNNAGVVEKYQAGKTNLFQFFVGQVMKETKGKANPLLIEKVLKRHLDKK